MVATEAHVEQVRARVADSLMDRARRDGIGRALIDTVEARQQVDQVRKEHQQLTGRHLRERTQLAPRIVETKPRGTAEAQAALWRKRVNAARRELAEIEALPVGQAAQLVREREQNRRDAVERASTARETRLTERGRNQWQPSANHPTRSADHRLGL